MHLYGTREDHFGIVAVGQRKWAQMSPWAQMKAPMTMDDHHNSRWIAEPLRLLDCCLVSNGAIGVIVTSPERARDLKQPSGPTPLIASGIPDNVAERLADLGIPPVLSLR